VELLKGLNFKKIFAMVLYLIWDLFEYFNQSFFHIVMI